MCRNLLRTCNNYSFECRAKVYRHFKQMHTSCNCLQMSLFVNFFAWQLRGVLTLGAAHEHFWDLSILWLLWSCRDLTVQVAQNCLPLRTTCIGESVIAVCETMAPSLAQCRNPPLQKCTRDKWGTSYPARTTTCEMDISWGIVQVNYNFCCQVFSHIIRRPFQ